MHMEAVQRYVISLSEEEAKVLFEEMLEIPSHIFSDKPNLQELYETLKIWT